MGLLLTAITSAAGTGFCVFASRIKPFKLIVCGWECNPVDANSRMKKSFTDVMGYKDEFI